MSMALNLLAFCAFIAYRFTLAENVCNFKCYHKDESLKSGSCESDCHCSSIRTCIDSQCSGETTYYDEPSCEMYKNCNRKCYDREEAFNSNGQHKCTDDCGCASMRQCVNGVCQGISTFFDEPTCSVRIKACVRYLQKYKLYHIWPTLQKHGFNYTSLWMQITDQMLQKMQIKDSDVKKFKELQSNLRCNTKCYTHEESSNLNGENQCDNDCECASIRKCMDGACSGQSTFFDEPSCDKRTEECIKWLEKFELQHIWPILSKNGFNATSLWPDITHTMLQNMNMKDADILRFKNLQKALVEAGSKNKGGYNKNEYNMYMEEETNQKDKACIKLLEKHDLRNIWGILKESGWTETNLWMDITRDMLMKMKIRDSDMMRFIKLQQDLRKQKQEI